MDNYFKLVLLAFIVNIITGCSSGSGSGDVRRTPNSDDYLSNIYNGYVLTSVKTYDAANNLLSTITYSINKTANVITRTSSTSGDIHYIYYNSDGEYIKWVKIDETDIGSIGSYSSSSYERNYIYDHNGLLKFRTTDASIDGDIDASVTWQYDANEFVSSIEYDTDTDGYTDVTVNNVWSNGVKLSSTRTESDGSSDTKLYSYSNNDLPSNLSIDEGSDGAIDRTYEYIVDSNMNITLLRGYSDSGALVVYAIYTYEATGDEIIANSQNRGFYFFY